MKLTLRLGTKISELPTLESQLSLKLYYFVYNKVSKEHVFLLLILLQNSSILILFNELFSSRDKTISHIYWCEQFHVHNNYCVFICNHQGLAATSLGPSHCWETSSAPFCKGGAQTKQNSHVVPWVCLCVHMGVNKCVHMHLEARGSLWCHSAVTINLVLFYIHISIAYQLNIIKDFIMILLYMYILYCDSTPVFTHHLDFWKRFSHWPGILQAD